MLRRDYFIKQVEEFGKVLALIMSLKRNGRFPDMLDELVRASQKYTALEIELVEKQPDEALVETLTDVNRLNDDQMKFMADLLFEKAEYYLSTQGEGAASTNCYRKALTIYRFLKEHATLNYSLDMHYKLELLSKMHL